MYLAEIRGKLSKNNENKEDILTSNVFSFFKYSDRTIFLKKFFELLGLNISDEEASSAEFYFWPIYPDGTEPDLVIITSQYYLLVEAKYHSGFGEATSTRKHQLDREIEGGTFEAENLNKIFEILIVTADYYKPQVAQNIPEHQVRHLHWIKWQSVAIMIFNLLQYNPTIRYETRLLAEDLYDLLVAKGLRNYEGVKALTKIPKLSRNPDPLFFQANTATFRGDFIGFQIALENLPKFQVLSDLLFRSKEQTNGKLIRNPPPIFFQADTATFRGDFFGFQSALGNLPKFQLLPKKLFLETEHLLFQFPMAVDNPFFDRINHVFFTTEGS